MTIADFTNRELQYFRKECNFVNLEIVVFERRSQGVPLEQIAEDLHISYDYARKISCKVNKKILKVVWKN